MRPKYRPAGAGRLAWGLRVCGETGGGGAGRGRDDGRAVDLTSEQEAIATMYASMSKTDYASKKVFRDNFWAAFRAALGKDHT